MPMRPRSGSRFWQRQRKSWSSSSTVGVLKGWTSTPCGFTPLMTCLIVPRLTGGVHRPEAPAALTNDRRRTGGSWYSASKLDPLGQQLRCLSLRQTFPAVARVEVLRQMHLLTAGTRRGSISSWIRLWRLSLMSPPGPALNCTLAGFPRSRPARVGWSPSGKQRLQMTLWAGALLRRRNGDLVRAIIDYALMRLRLDPVPLGHPSDPGELTAQVGQTITAEGIGGGRASNSSTPCSPMPA